MKDKVEEPKTDLGLLKKDGTTETARRYLQGYVTVSGG